MLHSSVCESLILRVLRLHYSIIRLYSDFTLWLLLLSVFRPFQLLVVISFNVQWLMICRCLRAFIISFIARTICLDQFTIISCDINSACTGWPKNWHTLFCTAYLRQILTDFPTCFTVRIRRTFVIIYLFIYLLILIFNSRHKAHDTKIINTVQHR